MLKFLFFIYCIAVSPFVSAFVMKKLWHWYMVPGFGLHEISTGAAIGLMFIVSFLTHGHATRVEVNARFAGDDEEAKSKAWWAAVFFAFFYPPLALLFGYIFRGYV